MNNKIQDKLSVLTSHPGVYIMKNQAGTIIYVGKAKNLKNRVSQYFVNNSQHTVKVLKMVSNVDDFEYIVTHSELEALILENNLIKKHQPKYNILLKDDKNYPFIALDKNSFYPRFTVVRRRTDKNYKYFGPFQSGNVAYEIVNTINDVFKLYSCNLKFPRDFNKSRPCLMYHIGKCCGLCMGNVSSDDYRKTVDEAISFLHGDYKKYISEFEKKMQTYSEELEFEKAGQYRDKIHSIKKLEQKQVIMFSPEVSRDIIAYSILENDVCFSVAHIRTGRLIFQDTVFLSEISDDLTGVFIERYYQDNDMIPKEIAVMTMPEEAELLSQWLSELKGSKVKLFTAQKGENSKLIDMCKKNAEEKLAEKKSNGIRVNKLMAQIAQMLGIDGVPDRIEMYDISNYGTDTTVGGMVVYQNGRFKRSEYRTFNFEQVYLQNDYKYTHDMIERRLLRYDSQSEGFESKPDIIFLDGGAGHLNTVYELAAMRSIPIFGLVKDKKHRTRGIVGINGEVDIRSNPAVFKFFTNLQDEVHRFAIGRMKNKKSKSMVESGLMQIKGLGKVKYKALMDKFKTVKAIQKCGIEELEAVKGITHSIAVDIKNYLDGDS